MTPEELDKLEAIVKAMTPGDWYVDSSRRGIETQTDVGAVEVGAWMGQEDAAAIVALHNAAPALIAAARDLAWHEERHGTRAEQEALDAALAVDLARIDALSDEECEAELAAEGIDYDAARKKIDVTLKLCAERADLKREVGRLRDLVRHQRGPLFDADLITKAEYAALAGDAGAVARLEGYDAARAEAERLRAFVPVWRPKAYGDNLIVWRLHVGGSILVDSGIEIARSGAVWTCADAVRHATIAEAAAAVCARLGIPDVPVEVIDVHSS